MNTWVKNTAAIILVAAAIAAIVRLYVTNPVNPCSCSRMGDRVPQSVPRSVR